MIDKRFIHKNDAFDHFNQRLQATEKKVQDCQNWQVLTETLQSWWETVLQLAIQTNQDNAKNGEIAEWLWRQLPPGYKPSDYIVSKEISLPSELLDALDNFETQTEYQNQLTIDFTWYALGTAVGKSLANIVNTVSLKNMLIAYSFFETKRIGIYALEACWLKTLLTTDQQTWIDEVHRAIKTLSANPIDCFMEKEIAKAQLEEWEQTFEMSKVWEESPIDPLFFNHLTRILDLARQLDKVRYLDIIEDLKFPIIIRDTLKNYKITQDRDEILSLLESAKTVLDESKNWNKCIVALLLTETIVSHARYLIESVKRLSSLDENELKNIQKQEIPEWFKKAFNVLLNRTDGKDIGIHWLIELIERYQREIWRSNTMDWSVTVTAIEYLAQSLADKNYFFTEIDAEKIKKNGLSKLLAAVLIAEKKPVLAESDKLWQWFENLLLAKDKGIKNHFYSMELTQNWVHYQPANLLAHGNNPVEQWQQIWNKLQEQRNLAMYNLEENDALASSQFLIQIGICTLDWLLDFEKNELAIELWQVLYDALRETWLTQQDDINNTWCKLISYLFARENKIFKSQADYLKKVLPQHLKPLWGNDSLIAMVSVNLTHNGLSPQDLLQAFKTAEIDVIESINTYNAWGEATKKSFQINTDISNLLDNLNAISVPK